MSLSAFDPICLERYEKPPYLLHFQWGSDELKVYRYALVEIMTINDVDHKLKQKDNERGLTQKEIWERILRDYKIKNTPLPISST